MSSVVEPAPADSARVRFRIDKMDCPTEERLIRQRLEPMAGVIRLDFNLLARELTVYHRLNDTEPLASALRDLDMAPALLEDGQGTAPLPPALPKRLQGLLALAGLSAVGAEAVAWWTGQEQHLLVLALAAISIAAAGRPTLKKGWIALRHLTLNIYFLMTLAVAGALAIGNWAEAAMVIFLFAVAEAIEALSLERARHAIQALSALAPDQADVLTQGRWMATPVAQVPVGSRIRIRTGERVPLDGRIALGHAALNQAPITGESLPVDKQVGDPLFAGSIVTDGVIEAEVTATAGESTLARIASAIQEAQSQRAPTQRFVDQFARYYTPTVVALAVAVAVVGPWLTGGPWHDWLYEALVMLVIACPCALVVSTPVTVVSGLAAAARLGILIKGGAHLEGGHRIRAAALDKTGTLTLGRPALTDVLPLHGMDAHQALRVAASLDSRSTHPVAQAVVEGWRHRQPGDTLVDVSNFAVLQGRGVRGDIAGRTWHLGNHRLVEERGLCSPELEVQLQALEQVGKTTMVLSNDHQPVCILAAADTLRPETPVAIAQLKDLGITPVMLTGDNPATAGVVSRQAGIQACRANLLPEDKLTAMTELIAQHGQVAMVGDGV
ncbi:MAG TPA: heavy metal translocating P-type ATPase, partial [Aquabacterium sp.]|nr:heavy metal translocating P-type ATPase [Aquabacterium sp.]